MNAPMPPNAVAVASIPIAEIVNSLTNPRKRFDAGYITELAATIKDKGIIQPITVRPASVDRILEWNRKEGAGRIDPAAMPKYELVVGECRWRAAKQAGLTEVPAFWRELDDKQVLEIQVIENLQRRDVHPLEEAEGYEALMKHHGYTAESLADKVGKSKAYIYARIKLTACGKGARDAFFAGELDASRALLIARIPGDKLQAEALQKIVKGKWNDGPMSYREAADYVQANFMLRLAEAPFPRGDETLVPKAGRCNDCPMRTGNQKELFTDVKSADVCTDPGCYHEKVEAHAERQRIAAKAEGRKVIVGAEAKKLKPESYSRVKGEYVQIDEYVTVDGATRPLAKLLGKDAPKPDLLVDPHNKDNLIEVMSRATLKEHLAAKGMTLDSAGGGGKSDAEKKTEEKRKRELEFRRRLFDRIRSELTVNAPQALSHDDLLRVADSLYHLCDFECQKRLARLWHGPDDTKQDDHKLVHQLRERIPKLGTDELLRIIIETTLVGEVAVPTWSDRKPENMLAVAQGLGIDADAIKAQILAESRDKAKKKGAKKPAAKVQPETATSTDPLIGKRVRIKNDLRAVGGKTRKCCGREGTVEGAVGAYYTVRFGPKAHEIVTNLVWNEFDVIEPAGSETAPDAPRAAQAQGQGAREPAAPAKGKTAKAAKSPKAKTTPAPATPSNEPAAGVETSASGGSAPVKTEQRVAWPFPTGSRP